ncbi:MAG: hypothetical protein ACJ76V_02975 [Thermoleophilaceae bacterium]
MVHRSNIRIAVVAAVATAAAMVATGTARADAVKAPVAQPAQAAPFTR